MSRCQPSQSVAPFIAMILRSVRENRDVHWISNPLHRTNIPDPYLSSPADNRLVGLPSDPYPNGVSRRQRILPVTDRFGQGW
jgi:hypothetical protein